MGDWYNTLISAGDRIHVIWDRSGQKAAIDNEHNLLIVHPDVLVSGRSVGESFRCIRKTTLEEKIRSEVSSPPPSKCQ